MLSASDVIIVVSNQMNAGDAARISISNELLEGQYSVQLTQKKRKCLSTKMETLSREKKFQNFLVEVSTSMMLTSSAQYVWSNSKKEIKSKKQLVATSFMLDVCRNGLKLNQYALSVECRLNDQKTVVGRAKLIVADKN